MPFRFVHTADIHLDSPLKSLALRDPDLAEIVGNATRQVFSDIVTLCIEESVDALLIAGDLYDGDQTSMNTAKFLTQELRRLEQVDIRVFIVRGNHDAESKITRELTMPDNVHIFSGKAEVVECERDNLAVAVHGISFRTPHAPDSLVEKFKPPRKGAINLAMLHTSLGGAAGHDSYAPCKLSDLYAAGFHYWALGHIHKRSVNKHTNCTVVMPGIPQGRDIGEDGAKSVTLVTISDEGVVVCEERITCSVQFQRVDIEIRPEHDWRTLVNNIAHLVKLQRTQSHVAHLLVRVTVRGSTDMLWKLRRDTDLLLHEVQARTSELTNTWVEKIKLDCHAQTQTTNTGFSPLLELEKIISDDVLSAASYQEQLKQMAEELMSNSKIPRECRDLFGVDAESFSQNVSAFASEGAQAVLARLHTLNQKESHD